MLCSSYKEKSGQEENFDRALVMKRSRKLRKKVNGEETEKWKARREMILYFRQRRLTR